MATGNQLLRARRLASPPLEPLDAGPPSETDAGASLARVGGGGDEEKGADGLCGARRNGAGGNDLGWHGNGSLHVIAGNERLQPRRPQATGPIIRSAITVRSWSMAVLIAEEA